MTLYHWCVSPKLFYYAFDKKKTNNLKKVRLFLGSALSFIWPSIRTFNFVLTAIVPRRCGAPLKSTALLCVCLYCFLVSTKMPSNMPIVKLCQIKMWIAEYNAKYKICAQECREYMVYHVRACSFLLSTEQYTRYLLNARYQVKSNCKELSRSTLWPNS